MILDERELPDFRNKNNNKNNKIPSKISDKIIKLYENN